MKRLEILGAIKLPQTGKRGAHLCRAALYVREARITVLVSELTPHD